MKSLLNFFVFALLFCTISCHAQQMVQKVNDAKKLEINKERFIGKPLKELLSQIAPKVMYVYGNPDNRSPNAIGGTYIKIFLLTGMM